MNLNIEKINSPGAYKISVEKDNKVAGRAYLYLIKNDLHDQPYGLLEDLFVQDDFRGQGLGKELLQKVIEEAKKNDCYKLVAQSRHERCEIHDFYKKFGFVDHGKNFRMNLNSQ